jgi:NADH-quinone oxidoreductase subunit J
MSAMFYLAAFVAVLSTALAITRAHAVHALLYLIVSLLAVAMIFLLLGAPLAAALEVIIYAGAIMVLFVFVIMMLDNGRKDTSRNPQRLPTRMWTGPALLSAMLFGEFLYLFAMSTSQGSPLTQVGPKDVGIALLGTYVIGVELASMLLLSGLVGAYYLGRRIEQEEQE